MCGLFGFAGSAVDSRRLRLVAAQAARRGPDAWGVAWALRPDAELEVFKEPRALPRPETFARVGPAQRVIGHCRLATSGQAADNANNQPLLNAVTAVAHNGVVDGHRALAAALGVQLATACDSELLLHLATRPHELRQALGSKPYALLLLHRGLLLGLRHRHPLFVEARQEGVYVGSRAWEGAQPVEDDLLVRIGC